MTDPQVDEKMLDHSGYIAVIGRPNVGKSTLMNRILGEKIAIVSPKPQTTRLRQLGIYSTETIQAIFMDTPGIHEPRHKLGEFMVTVAIEALRDADVILFVLDLSEAPTLEDKHVATLLRESATGAPVVLALNKLDTLRIDQVEARVTEYRHLVEDADWEAISASKGNGVEVLMKRIIERLPSGPQFYPEDQLSDTALRHIAAEIIREKIMLHTEKEIPHAVAVEIDEFKEGTTLTAITATIYVERDTQKGIIIGKSGAMLKQIGMEARHDIEQLMSTKVHLQLWVKVLKNWRKDDSLLKRFGYKFDKQTR
jgi:GTP-binding protein Era